MRPLAVSRRAFLASVPFLACAVRAADPEISDDALYDKVNRQLITDRDLGVLPLTVKVENGVVTVTGYVKSDKHQKRVDKLVKKVKGVRQVVNRTEVRTDL